MRSLAVLVFLSLVLPGYSVAQQKMYWYYSLEARRTAIAPVNSSSFSINELGFGDFNGDGKTDVLSHWGGHWHFSSGGTGAWTKLAKSKIPIRDLGFGDFNGDGRTDVLSHWGGRWHYSSGANYKWKPLAKSKLTVKQLRFGDFDGDGKTDVFAQWNGYWHMSSGGSQKWKKLRESNISVNKLGFGDFNGDGRTDVLSHWSGRWHYSSGGTGRWVALSKSDLSIDKLRIGDFNGDGRADVLSRWGGRWQVSYSGLGPWQPLSKSNVSVELLRVGDFNGDSISDVFYVSREKKRSLAGTSGHRYLGNYPKHRNVNWGHDVQGIANSLTHWFLTNTKCIFKASFRDDLNKSVKTKKCISGIRQLAAIGLDHIGDPDHFYYEGRGYLVVPIDNGDFPVFAFFNSDSFRFVAYGAVPVQEQVPFVAIDFQGYAFSTESRRIPNVYKYEIDWKRVFALDKAGRTGKVDIGLDNIKTLKDENGRHAHLTSIQGGVYSGDGTKFYLVNGYYKKPQKNWGVHVFCTKDWRRAARSQQGGDGFRYQFHAGSPKYEEPEGLTFFESDGKGAPGISGSLHILLLDNDGAIDSHKEVYLKHYSVSRDGHYCGDPVR